MTLERRNSIWFAAGIGLLITSGLVLRFTNLDLKLYWQDEVYTSLMSASYRTDEITAELLAAPEITPQMLNEYLKPKPGSGLSDVLQTLVVDHVPLYYLISRGWMVLVGDSPAAMRLLAALISVLVLPCVFWLCLELFQSRRTAWLAIGLLSVSPFFVLYAQEARPYSLLTLATALSSAALLYALKLGGFWRWALYAAAATLGLLSHFLFALVVAAHGLSLVLLRCFAPGPERPSLRAIASFLLAAGAGLLAVSPWLALRLLPRTNDLLFDWWLSEPKPWGHTIVSWVGSACSPFMGLTAGLWVQAVLGMLVLIVVVYALVWLVKRARLQTWLFVCLLVAIPAGTLLVMDLIFGGQRSTHARFLTPSLFGLLLAVAHLLATQTRDAPGRQSRRWQVLTGALLALSLFSSVTIVRTQSWWSKGNDEQRWHIVRAINTAERPLVFMNEPSSGEISHLIVLGRYLKPDVRIRWGDKNLAGVDANAREVFWLNWPKERDEPLVGPYGLRAEELTSSTLQGMASSQVAAGEGISFGPNGRILSGVEGGALWRLQPADQGP